MLKDTILDLNAGRRLPISLVVVKIIKPEKSTLIPRKFSVSDLLCSDSKSPRSVGTIFRSPALLTRHNSSIKKHGLKVSPFNSKALAQAPSDALFHVLFAPINSNLSPIDVTGIELKFKLNELVKHLTNSDLPIPAGPSKFITGRSSGC